MTKLHAFINDIKQIGFDLFQLIHIYYEYIARKKMVQIPEDIKKQLVAIIPVVTIPIVLVYVFIWGVNVSHGIMTFFYTFIIQSFSQSAYVMDLMGLGSFLGVILIKGIEGVLLYHIIRHIPSLVRQERAGYRPINTCIWWFGILSLIQLHFIVGMILTIIIPFVWYQLAPLWVTDQQENYHSGEK